MSRPARRSFIGSIASRSARHLPTVVVVWLALLATGGFAYLRGLGQEGFPVVNLPFVSMRVTYLVDDAEQVDAEIAVPLAETFLEADGVTTVFTRASANGVNGFVDFESSMTSNEGVAILESITPELPPGATIEFAPIEPTKYLNRFDLLVSVTSDPALEPEELQRVAKKVAESIAELATVDVATVVPSFRSGVDPETGIDSTRQTSFSRVALEPAEGFVDSALIGVSAAEAVDAVELRDTVDEELVSGGFGDGIEATVSAALADGIESQRQNLEANLVEGLVAVSLVGLVVIGWRTALVTALFMPTTLAATLAVLWAIGQTLNTITLFALILTLGLLVDDAIVIAEAIDAHRDDDRPRLDVVRDAVGSVGLASLAGTFTTVLVFCPMLFVSGVLGQFIRVMPITVIITLVASLVLSVTLVSAAGRAFLLGGSHRRSPMARAIHRMGDAVAGLVGVGARPSVVGVVVSVLTVSTSIVATVTGVVLLGRLDFDVFPRSEDSNGLVVELDVDGAEGVAGVETVTREADRVILDELGPDVVRALYVDGSSGGAAVLIDLVPYDEREATAPALVERLEERLDALPGIRAAVSQVDPAPAPAEYPFAVQIDASNDPVAAELLAVDLADRLRGQTLVRPNGREATMLDAIVSTGAAITRDDGVRYLEVRASFDGDDTSGLLELARERTGELFPTGELAERGLEADALSYDFGQESENSEGFASATRALLIALVAMLVLLAVQFRSIVQPLLIVSAIPFAMLGVGLGLRLTGNPLSFFVMIGLIGLIGIVVNNTILLVDAANQERALGATPIDAIAAAISRRFRPLVATTATSVVGLAPLALADPFWEPMAVTIMFGLVSSTALVLTAFPYYYLVVETAREAVSSRVGRRSRVPTQASMSTTVTDSAPPGA